MQKYYKIIRKIGEGEHGSVYLVKKTVLYYKRISQDHDFTEEQFYAMKKIPLSKNSFNFQQKLLLSLNHPNVIKIHQTFNDKNHLSLILDLAEEGDLHQYLKRNYLKAVPQTLVTLWLCQLSLGLHYLHIQNNIIHRDIKLRNILIKENGLIKFADFGVARKLQKGEDFAKTSVGTPCYLSPEAINLGKYDSKSDVWSLGCLMYQICCGEKPFQGDSLGVLLHNIVFNQFGEVPKRYSKWIKDLITQMLQKDPQKRPSIVNILQNPHIKKQFKQLRYMYPQYQKIVYPEQGPKTTKYLDIEDRRLSCLKIFSESLKTTKNQKCIKLEIQDKNSISDSSSNNNKSQKQRSFVKNDLIPKNNRQAPLNRMIERKSEASFMQIKTSEVANCRKEEIKKSFNIKGQVSCSLNKVISPSNQAPRRVERDKFMDKSLKSIMSKRTKDRADKQQNQIKQ